MTKEILESFNKLMMKDKIDLAFMLMEQVADNCNLQQQNNKAIEYIRQTIKERHGQISKEEENLLSILQGEDEK